MVLDVGRIKHLGDLMHKSISSNGSAVTSNWRLSADGLTNVVWTPESSATVSYASNSNDVAASGAAGASTLVSRAEHTHRGISSLAVSSNTVFGPATLVAEGQVGITYVSPGTIKLNVSGAVGGGGSTLGVIGVTRYHNATDTGTFTTTSSTQADVDATNAKVVFTAPSSGKILVRVACIAGNSSGAANDYFGIRESTTDVVTKQICHTITTNSMCVREFYITGVSAGSHTYKMAFATSAGTFTLYTGPTFGDIEITVWEVV